MKAICEMLIKGQEDGTTDVRDAAAEAMGTLMKLLGERPLLLYLEKLDNLKTAKVKEFCESAVIKGLKKSTVVAPTGGPVKKPLSKPVSRAGSKGLGPPSSSAHTNSNSMDIDMDDSSAMPPPSTLPQRKLTIKKPVVSSGYGVMTPMPAAEDQHSRPSSAFGGLQSSPPKKAGVQRRGTSQMHLPVVQAPPRDEFGVLPGDPKQKLKRAQDDRGPCRWVLDGTRPDLVEFLQEQFQNCFTQPLINLLFSNGHYKEKDHMVGLTSLDEFLVARNPDCLHHVDVILKYISLRFQDTNTTMLLKCLDIVEHLVQLLEDHGHNLSEYEANAFIPSLLQKTGDSKEVIRSRIRSLLVAFNRLYPPSKLFSLILKATESKNARIRAECIEELGFMISRSGFGCCNVKSIPTIASFISEREATVRNASLGALVEVARAVGEAQMYKYVGRIAEKDKTLLEQKIKRAGVLEPPVTPSRGDPMEIDHTPVRNTPRAAPVQYHGQSASMAHRHSQPEMQSQHSYSSAQHGDSNQMQLDNPVPSFSAPSFAYATNSPTQSSIQPRSGIVPPNSTHFMLTPEKVGVSQLSSKYDSLHQKDTVMDFVVTQITSGDALQALEALRQVEKIIPHQPQLLSNHADQLIVSIALQARLAFTALDNPAVMRLCKHLLNTLLQFYDVPSLVARVSVDTHVQLLTELLKRLVYDQLQQREGGEQLIKALNMLVVRIVDKIEPDVVFQVSFKMLIITISAPYVDVELDLRYKELVIKCLWKLVRSLESYLQDGRMDVPLLMQGIHQMFLVFDPNEAKKKDDAPLTVLIRTMKTILSELVKTYGDQVLGYFTLVNNLEDSYIYSYTQNLLESQRNKQRGKPGTKTPRSMSTQDLSQPDEVISSQYANQTYQAENRSQNSIQMHSTQMQYSTSAESDNMMNALNQLSAIFSKVASKDQSKEGIYELHVFQQKYPQLQTHVDEYMSRTGSFFQTYIKRNLALLEKEETSRNLIPSNPPSGVLLSQSGIPHAALAEPSSTEAHRRPSSEYQQSNLHQSPFSGIPTSQFANHSSSSTAQTVTQLRERLARMRMNIQSTSTVPGGQ
jgi:hypothetical protein